jgi:hypothetical protein
LEHEKAYIESLRSKGIAVVDLSNETEEVAGEATWAAMKSGADAIVQATLGSGDWRGRTDVLLRVEQIEKPSRLGNWSYEVVDCKLARETKAETILQLCLYSELVTELQGLEPEFFHVIRPNVGFEPESGLCHLRRNSSALLPILKGAPGHSVTLVRCFVNSTYLGFSSIPIAFRPSQGIGTIDHFQGLLMTQTLQLSSVI